MARVWHVIKVETCFGLSTLRIRSTNSKFEWMCCSWMASRHVNSRQSQTDKHGSHRQCSISINYECITSYRFACVRSWSGGVCQHAATDATLIVSMYVCLYDFECQSNEWARVTWINGSLMSQQATLLRLPAHTHVGILTFSRWILNFVNNFYDLMLLKEHDIDCRGNVWDKAGAQVFAHRFMALLNVRNHERKNLEKRADNKASGISYLHTWLG